MMANDSDEAGFPLPLDLAPMEARLADDLPVEAGWQFEPKWDGFRCLTFRADDRVELRAKSGKPLTRYFPEVAWWVGFAMNGTGRLSAPCYLVSTMTKASSTMSALLRHCAILIARH